MEKQNMVKIKRALMSVSDKQGIVEFARDLQALNVEIISTGGTYKLLNENNIQCKKTDEDIIKSLDSINFSRNR